MRIGGLAQHSCASGSKAVGANRGGKANPYIKKILKSLSDAAAGKQVDLEELGLAKNRLSQRSGKGLRVSDLAAAEWCQQQVALTASRRIVSKQQEKQMSSGTGEEAG